MIILNNYNWFYSILWQFWFYLDSLKFWRWKRKLMPFYELNREFDNHEHKHTCHLLKSQTSKNIRNNNKNIHIICTIYIHTCIKTYMTQHHARTYKHEIQNCSHLYIRTLLNITQCNHNCACPRIDTLAWRRTGTHTTWHFTHMYNGMMTCTQTRAHTYS